MALKKLQFLLQGVSPLILHNGQTADPLNKFAKAMKQISSKRAKTDADYEAMAKLEWQASLYINKEGRICLPDFGLESAFASGARKLKLGKHVQAGLFVDRHCPLIFDGDTLSLEELWERDENRLTVAVRVQRNRVMRTRFKVDEWSAIVPATYSDGLLNKSQIVDIIAKTGEECGMFDWRPKFGRFVSEIHAAKAAA